MFAAEEGQDLIEYALLVAFVAFAGLAAFSLMGISLNTTYTSWNDAVQSDALVEMPDPIE